MMKLPNTLLAWALALPNVQSFVVQRQAVLGSTRALGQNNALKMSSGGLDLSKKVVITGLGPVSGCGIGIEKFWENVVEGVSSIDKVTNFDASKMTCQIASEVKDLKTEDFFNDPRNIRTNDRFTHFAVAASRLAVEDAGLDLDSVDMNKMGVMIGSAFGGMQTFEDNVLRMQERGARMVSPFAIPGLLGNTAAGVVGIELGCKGPNFGAVSACASATHCLGEALRAIQAGDADIMLAGGTEAAVTPLSFAGFNSMKAMATSFNDNPQAGSRPFDKNRAGFVMGEGAGVVVLETLDHALARGARIYCELAGYGATCDAHHITTPAPEGEGLARCLARALETGGIKMGGKYGTGGDTPLGYINAHGTSTQYNDKFETMAIKSVMGDEMASSVHISSTKCVTGHTLGAAGGIEAIVCAKVIQTGIVPPTTNYETPDEECDLNYTPNTKVELDSVEAAVSTNLGFGGHNAAVSFKKVEK